MLIFPPEPGCMYEKRWRADRPHAHSTYKRPLEGRDRQTMQCSLLAFLEVLFGRSDAMSVACALHPSAVLSRRRPIGTNRQRLKRRGAKNLEICIRKKVRKKDLFHPARHMDFRYVFAALCKDIGAWKPGSVYAV